MHLACCWKKTFPPLSLIGTRISKIMNEEASSITIMSPVSNSVLISHNDCTSTRFYNTTSKEYLEFAIKQKRKSSSITKNRNLFQFSYQGAIQSVDITSIITIIVEIIYKVPIRVSALKIGQLCYSPDLVCTLMTVHIVENVLLVTKWWIKLCCKIYCRYFCKRTVITGSTLL